MINKKYLPSKKFVIALSISLFVVLVVIIINYTKTNTTTYVNSLAIEATNTAASLNIDSDNDGLPDWKEALYGTDPHNPDTDGDGTTDGDEVAQGRDPLKPNTAPKGQKPNDYIDPAIIEQNQKTIDDYKKLTDTEKFSRDLFANIIANQPVSGQMDQATIDSIVSNAAQDIPQKNFSGTTTIEDLNLQKTDSTNLTQNLSSYSKNLKPEEEKIASAIGTNLNLIDTFFANNNVSVSAGMLKLDVLYQSIINDLIKMPVPVAIGVFDIHYHLTLINDLEMAQEINQDNINSDAGSVSVMNNVSLLNSVLNDIMATVQTINSVLKNNI